MAVAGFETRSQVISMLVKDSDTAYVSEQTLRDEALALGRGFAGLESSQGEELIYAKLGAHVPSLKDEQISVRISSYTHTTDNWATRMVCRLIYGYLMMHQRVSF